MKNEITRQIEKTLQYRNSDELDKLRQLINQAGEMTPELRNTGDRENPKLHISQRFNSAQLSMRAVIDTTVGSFNESKGANGLPMASIALGLPVLNWLPYAGVNINYIDNNIVDETKLPLIDGVNVNWVAENTAPGADANPTLTSKEMAFRQVSTYLDVSRRVMKGKLFDVDDYLITEIGKAVYASIADKVLTGDTTSNEIEGIINRSGIDTQDASTLGEQVALTNAFQAISLASGMPNMILANPNTRETLQNTLWEATGTSTTGSRPLWEYNLASPTSETCMGLPATINNSLADGTVVVGDFRSLRLYAHKEIDFIVHTVGKATVDGSTRIAAHVFVESFLRPEHFSVITGVA